MKGHRWVSALKRSLYRGGRPAPIMRVLNRLDAMAYGAGWLTPRQAATLEVVGRRTGRTISIPVAVADHAGERYLVSMLGPDANWVRNVRAAGGRAALRRRRREAVVLEEVPEEARAAVLRRYLAIAPGARPHFPVAPRAPLAEFEAVASQYPVFRVTSVP